MACVMKPSSQVKDEPDSKAASDPNAPAARQATAADIGCSERDRFVMELEFVQLLANSDYLNWLAQNRYFQDPVFLKYLDYLQYWRRKEYCSYITFPHCLRMLELLQQAEFRKLLAVKNAQLAIAWQQQYFHLHYRKNRVREAADALLSGTTGEASGAATQPGAAPEGGAQCKVADGTPADGPAGTGQHGGAQAEVGALEQQGALKQEALADAPAAMDES